jgi:hypothetical protein
MITQTQQFLSYFFYSSLFLLPLYKYWLKNVYPELKDELFN